ncbi:MAG: DHHW family protein [Hydrogeniiclostridium mannosilyticum]
MKKMEAFKESVKQCKPEYLAVTLLLFVTILAGLAYLAFVPKQTFSEEENRALEEIPQLSLENLADGSFMSSAESYVGDHFMLRQAFISLSTTVKLGLGFRDVGGNYSSVPAEGGVYFGGNGHLYEVLLPNKDQVFAQNVKGLAAFCEGAGLPFSVVPVPSGAQEQAQNLPLFSYSHNQREEFEALRAAIGENGAVVDLFDALNLWNGDYYYKTDHHWNTEGAYVGYTALAKEMGFTPTDRSQFEFKLVSNDFYGTLYSKAISPFQEPDSMYLPILKEPQHITQTTGSETREGLYWEEYLGKKDKYSAFLGGNHSVDVIRNSDVKSERKLMILKDSYANSMIPFLATNFSEIHVVDLRYYAQNLYTYIDENGITDIAAIYSIKQLCDTDVSRRLLAPKPGGAA